MSRRSYRKKKKQASIIADLLSLIAWMIGMICELIIVVIPSIIYGIWCIWGYNKSVYHEVTHKSLFSVIFDKGARGEYLIYRHLKKTEGSPKWLFNVYLPREHDRTTEVDAIMIHKSGIYVFESKNYSGWIFGSENRKVWTQCLRPSENSRTRKYHFLNPIMQNKLHLRYLYKAIPELQNLPVYSIILFGNKCKLKKIELTTNDHMVISRKQVKQTVKNLSSGGCRIDEVTEQAIYDKLYPLTQVSAEVKEKHIRDIEQEVAASKDSDEGYVTSPSFEQPPVMTEQNHAASDTSEPKATRPSQRICPKCGAALTLRTVKQGQNAGQQFWGCSKYPQCRYTESVTQTNFSDSIDQKGNSTAK